MTATAIIAGLAALLALAPRTASASGLEDDCVVRRIEQTGDTLHVAIDIERSAVEQQIRTSAQSAIAKFQGATLDGIRLRVLDPTTLHIDADFTAKLQHGNLSLELKGTLGAQVTLAVADGKAVRVSLAPDTLTIDGKTVPLNGKVPGVSSDIALPDLGGQLQVIRIADPGASWLEVGLDVRRAPPPPTVPDSAPDSRATAVQPDH